jgi:hypothetical protein
LSRIPEVAAALVCQVLVTDTATQSKSLTNVFSIVRALMLPTLMTMGLYVKLIDGEGAYRLQIRFVRVRDDKTLFVFPMQTAVWPVPFEPMEVCANFQVQLEEEGMHEFQVFADDIYVGRSSFVVKKIVITEQTGGNT